MCMYTYKNFIISIKIKAFAAILISKPIPMACESIWLLILASLER